MAQSEEIPEEMRKKVIKILQSAKDSEAQKTLSESYYKIGLYIIDFT